MSLRYLFSKTPTELKERLLAQPTESELPSTTEQKTAPNTPIIVKTDTKSRTALTNIIALSDQSIATITSLMASTNAQHNDSCFAHIKRSMVQTWHFHINLVAIKNQIEPKQDLLENYKKFAEALEQLDEVKAYFMKTPYSNDPGFLKMYEFHKKPYENPASDVAKIIKQCEPYQEFIKGIVNFCSKNTLSPSLTAN